MSDLRVPCIEVRRVRWFAVGLAVTAIGLAGCGGDDGDGTTSNRDRPVAEGGEPILIKTSVRVRRDGGSGEVLRDSHIGDSAFCPGGRFSDRHGEPPLGLVVKTFRCPDGRLTITFSPTEDGPVQSSAWSVVSGTGRFKGLRLRSGKGQMKARFRSADDPRGNETFTGTVAP